MESAKFNAKPNSKHLARKLNTKQNVMGPQFEIGHRIRSRHLFTLFPASLDALPSYDSTMDDGAVQCSLCRPATRRSAR